MKIQLLTQDQHAELLNIYQSFPELTLENKGYEGINRREFSQQAKEADSAVNAILKESIIGFSSFQNFCHTKEGDIRLRVQYNWGAEDNTMPFTGVGYILLDELLNGFTENTIKS
jgi:hypothetical protein